VESIESCLTCFDLVSTSAWLMKSSEEPWIKTLGCESSPCSGNPSRIKIKQKCCQFEAFKPEGLANGAVSVWQEKTNAGYLPWSTDVSFLTLSLCRAKNGLTDEDGSCWTWKNNRTVGLSRLFIPCWSGVARTLLLHRNDGWPDAFVAIREAASN